MRWTLGVTGLIVTLGASSCSGNSGPVGDPGGAIIRQLSTIQMAVPPGAHAGHPVRQEPVFTRSCFSTQPGVGFSVSFVSTESVQRVRSQVARDLGKTGWGHPTHDGPGVWYTRVNGRQLEADNYIDRWNKRLLSGMKEEATLQVGVPLGSSSHAPLTWLLGATAASVGGPTMHCGEG